MFLMLLGQIFHAKFSRSFTTYILHAKRLIILVKYQYRTVTACPFVNEVYADSLPLHIFINYRWFVKNKNKLLHPEIITPI